MRTPSPWRRWRTTSSSSLPRFLAKCLRSPTWWWFSSPPCASRQRSQQPEGGRWWLRRCTSPRTCAASPCGRGRQQSPPLQRFSPPRLAEEGWQLWCRGRCRGPQFRWGWGHLLVDHLNQEASHQAHCIETTIHLQSIWKWRWFHGKCSFSLFCNHCVCSWHIETTIHYTQSTQLMVFYLCNPFINWTQQYLSTTSRDGVFQNIQTPIYITPSWCRVFQKQVYQRSFNNVPQPRPLTTTQVTGSTSFNFEIAWNNIEYLYSVQKVQHDIFIVEYNCWIMIFRIYDKLLTSFERSHCSKTEEQREDFLHHQVCWFKALSLSIFYVFQFNLYRYFFWKPHTWYDTLSILKGH